MPPHPKRKLSKGRRNRRRAHDALSAPNLVVCPECGLPRLSHRVCPNCGYYEGRQVIEVNKKQS